MKKAIAWLIAIAAGSALCFIILDYFNIFTAIGVDISRFNLDALAIVVSIVGCAIAGALTLWSVIKTIDASREEQKNENKRIVMPMIKISPTEYDYKQKYIVFDFNFTEESMQQLWKADDVATNIAINIKNVGQRELLDLHIGGFSSSYFHEGGSFYMLSPIVYADDSMDLTFYVYNKGIDYLDLKAYDTWISNITFDLYYKDCLGTWYTQKFTLSFMHRLTKQSEGSESELNITLERIHIDSSPIEYMQKILPWEQAGAKLIQC